MGEKGEAVAGGWKTTPSKVRREKKKATFVFVGGLQRIPNWESGRVDVLIRP